MARIVGIDIPRNKKVAYSLCYIHGIGLSTAFKICEKAKVDIEKTTGELRAYPLDDRIPVIIELGNDTKYQN